MNLNRALHCNQMIIHIYRERGEEERQNTHTHTKEDKEDEIDDHENGGIRE